MTHVSHTCTDTNGGLSTLGLKCVSQSRDLVASPLLFWVACGVSPPQPPQELCTPGTSEAQYRGWKALDNLMLPLSPFAHRRSEMSQREDGPLLRPVAEHPWRWHILPRGGLRNMESDEERETLQKKK